MLRPMRLVTQWQRIEQDLPEDWADARLRLTVHEESRFDRAAAMLGSLAPGCRGLTLLFHAVRSGAPMPEAVRRALQRLDDERIAGDLELLAAVEASGPETPTERDLAGTWDAAVAELPPDWSDVYAEVELTSSDHLDPAALAMAPLNPARHGPATGFRFRCARTFGYGASPGMVRRCLARLDERGIPGEVRVLRVLSDTSPAETQGPVWYLDGKVV